LSVDSFNYAMTEEDERFLILARCVSIGKTRLHL
jgi:hypothetical protein